MKYTKTTYQRFFSRYSSRDIKTNVEALPITLAFQKIGPLRLSKLLDMSMFTMQVDILHTLSDI
jgi:hypothetical protein